MIVCPRCSKENQDHYKFCLGCGAELPRDAKEPKSFRAPTPPGGLPAVVPDQPKPAVPSPAKPAAAAPAAASPPAASPPAASPPAAAAAPAGDRIDCPKCGTSNDKNFKFCGNCGAPLKAAAAPAAPTAASAAAAPAAGGDKRGKLVLIRPDGSEGETIHIGDGDTVGREAMPQFSADTYLSPKHASFHFDADSLEVVDLDSLNGVYFRIEREVPVELTSGMIFRIGQEIVRYDTLPEIANEKGVTLMGSPRTGLVGRIRLITGRKTHGNAYVIPTDGLHMGRERGDILFPDDGYVSGLHARLHVEGDKVFLTDMGSSNGTFIRVDKRRKVPTHSMLLMGQQLFRVEY